ncbi:MAG: phenylacetate--CoA ligase family protein [Lentisphaeria bacterium]|nr:phenylacetate--CoA ligase family protein [Lentisphaeria bacterium]
MNHAERSEIESITTREKLLHFQEKYLKQLILHAFENTLYYHRVFEEIGLVHGGLVDLSKFDKIPILTKDIFRKYYDELVSKDHATRKWYFNSSGGSTGEPLRFIQDHVYGKWGQAASCNWYETMLGIDELDARKVVLWGSERDIAKDGKGVEATVINWLCSSIFLNSFRMTEEDMKQYISKINSYKPELIRGYTGSLYELCKYAERTNTQIHSPKALVSCAETLDDQRREKLESVFGTKVYNFYASRETNNVAGECKQGLMHILACHNYIEILGADDKPVKEGVEGRVIVTNLHNHSMPFIRYEIGDMAVLGPQKCSCGSILPTLEKITGRITAHFVKKDGTVIHGGYFTRLFYLKDWLHSFQAIQEDYKKVRLVVVLADDMPDVEKEEIEAKVRVVMGEDCEIMWDFVDDIPKTVSGKYLYTRSKVWE